jgi:hypothetical protein
MKKLFTAARVYEHSTYAEKQNPFHAGLTPVLVVIVLTMSLVLSSCQKESDGKTQVDNQVTKNTAVNIDDDLRTFNAGLDPRTLWELQQVRAATARYRDANNAFKDNYVDINLKLANMGYHFLKSALVTPVFDLRKPPILVYNKREDGSFELLAAEYAIPIDQQHPDIAPEGFTGNADEWDFNTLNTGWWTLHAWIWKNNPDGVFKPMNPDVEVR